MTNFTKNVKDYSMVVLPLIQKETKKYETTLIITIHT